MGSDVSSRAGQGGARPTNLIQLRRARTLTSPPAARMGPLGALPS
jgi:hypothetical protein